MACGPEEVPLDFRGDLVLANLLARTLINLAPTLNQHLTDDGTLLASGIWNDQVSDVIGEKKSV